MQLNQLPIFPLLFAKKIRKNGVFLWKKGHPHAELPCSFLYFDFILHKRWHKNLQRPSILFGLLLAVRAQRQPMCIFVMNNTYIQLRMNSDKPGQFFASTRHTHTHDGKKEKKWPKEFLHKPKAIQSFPCSVRFAYSWHNGHLNKKKTVLDSIQIKGKEQKKQTVK